VEVGDSVIPGSPLFRIKNDNIQFNMDNLKTAFDLAQRNAGPLSPILSALEEEVASSSLKRANDSINLHRQQNLWKQGVGSKTELEQRELSFELSRKSHEMALSRLKQTRSDLQAKLVEARNNYNNILVNANDYLIRCQIKGEVFTISKELGELISPQMPMASIGSRANYILDMLIAEVDIVRLEIGQKILVTLDAYPDQVFEARVSKIYPSKDERTQTFRVEGEFVTVPAKLYPGLSGEVNIITGTKKDCLVVPNRFISENGEVMTDTGLTKIERGVSNMEFTEVLSGIDEKTEIQPLK
jgi:multidrug resistance efflux pump